MIVDVLWDGDDAVVPIPEDVMERMGWEIGMQLEYKIEDGKLIILGAKDVKPS